MSVSKVRVACACSVGCASWLLSLSAAAASLEMHGPQSCSDGEQLGFHVERLLGSSLEQVPRLGFRAQVSQTARGYQALLQVDDSEQPGTPTERQLGESSCTKLLDALAVVIVLAIHRTADTPALSAQTMEAPASPPAASAAIDAGGSTSNESAPALIPGAAAWLWVDVGALPDPSPGVGLSFELTRSRLRLVASGVFFPEQHVVRHAELSQAPGADLGLSLGALSACYSPLGPWRAELALGACLRGEVGRLYGRGSNVSNARSESRWWIAPGLDLLGSWQVHPALRLQAQMAATAPLARTEFGLGQLGEIYRPAAVTFRTGLGVAFEFN